MQLHAWESVLCHELPCPTSTAASARSAGKLLMRVAYVLVHNANKNLIQGNLKHGKKVLSGLAPERRFYLPSRSASPLQ